MSDALRSSAEIVLEPPAEPLVEPPEPSDQELARDYRPGFPGSPDPNAEIATAWGIMTYRQAVQRERAEYIARRRKSLQDRREREEQQRMAKAEAERKREEFDVGAREGKGRAALKGALAAYQQLQEQAHTLESALVESRATESFLRTSADPNNGKFAKDLGAAHDATLAAEVRVERTVSILQQAAQTLYEAITLGRAEYRFLHYQKRKERLQRAIDQFSSLFDRKAFARRLKINFEDLATVSHPVIHLDRATNFEDYRHRWTDLNQQRMREDGLFESVLPSAEILLRAATEVENCFVALDSITTS